MQAIHCVEMHTIFLKKKKKRINHFDGTKMLGLDEGKGFDR